MVRGFYQGFLRRRPKRISKSRARESIVGGPRWGRAVSAAGRKSRSDKESPGSAGQRGRSPLETTVTSLSNTHRACG